LNHALITRGPVQQVLELELELNTPLALSPNRKSRSKVCASLPIKTTITLTSGVPRLDIHTSVDNLARDHRLRVHFPAPFTAPSGAQDGHFEVVERRVGVPAFDETWVEQPRPEVPQRAFTSISNGISGLTVANRGLTEVEVLHNLQGNAEIAVTLLRCVGWLSRDDFSTRNGHAGPYLETPAAQMPGTWSFDYSIIPHSGNWQKAFGQAYAFAVPMRGISTGIHAGSLPSSGSFLEVEPGTFIVSSVKQSEDGRGWLVRGYNITAEALQVMMKPWKPYKNVERVNLAEEKLSTLKPDEGGAVSIPARGHEIISVLFRE
jgi:alpha-mannosidase